MGDNKNKKPACPACAAREEAEAKERAAEAEIPETEQNSNGHGCCCSHRTKDRSDEEYKDLIHRLNRIEGQVRGLKRMVEEGAYCPDILTQSAAAGSALNSFNRVLMGNHIRTCVADDIRQGNDETIDELLKTLQKFMR